MKKPRSNWIYLGLALAFILALIIVWVLRAAGIDLFGTT